LIPGVRPRSTTWPTRALRMRAIETTANWLNEPGKRWVSTVHLPITGTYE
jgi:hypothetical protein